MPFLYQSKYSSALQIVFIVVSVFNSCYIIIYAMNSLNFDENGCLLYINILYMFKMTNNISESFLQVIDIKGL